MRFRAVPPEFRYNRHTLDSPSHIPVDIRLGTKLLPTRKFTKSMVAAAILGYQEQKRQIDVEIAELRAMESESEPSSSGSESTPTERPKRKMSAATRKAMALAQQKRWAAKRGNI
jgi:hypothetical protein